MAEPSHGLPRSHAALEQARRIIDHLYGHEADPLTYDDLLPYALDRLLNVWRTIDDESSGTRPHAFGQWWADQNTGNRASLGILRNAELKSGYATAVRKATFKMKEGIRITESGEFLLVRPDGTEVSPSEAGIGRADADRTWWEFVVPGLEGREVTEVLETLYRQLVTKILPTAERLFTADA